MPIKFFLVAGEQIQQIRDALIAAKPYVECCAEPDRSDLASTAVIKIDDALALRFSEA